MRKQYGALVVGAGIAGIRAALDLAVTGHKVALIDKRPSHGGILSQLDYQFPSDHCGMCRMLPLMSRDASSQFCLRKGMFHENIDLMLSTELASLEGEPGKFFVSLSRRSPLVDPHKCVSCGKCSEVCPVKVPSEFNAGLTKRSAVYLPVPHAIPNHYVLDLDNCVRCWKCHDACPTGAIDLKFEERARFGILVADEDEQTRLTVRESLEHLHFPVFEASSGQEALDLLESDARINFVLAGLDLQGVDAQRVMARAKELYPGMPVAVLTAAGEEEAAAELIRRGARDQFMKPLASKKFVPWLDKHYMRIMSDTTEELQVSAVILAGGFDCYHPDMDPNGGRDIWGYGHPAVLTAVEFERLLSGTGPTGGSLTRPGDGKPVRRIAWIQCVGSRDVGKNANYCSSVCCMFSMKEAMLAKKVTNGEVDATIFYMDMRTFGKGWDDYRLRAVEQGVHFVRNRPHSVLPAAEGGGVVLESLNDDGTRRSQEFDMVVLAVGARPPKGMDAFAATVGVETNEWGFCKTQPYAPERTSRVGVFAAGSFGEPRDISESVMQAGAASEAAARMIKIYDVLGPAPAPPEPDYPDVSREPVRTLVAVCTSCPTLGKAVNLEELARTVGRVHSVGTVLPVFQACTESGWKQILETVRQKKPNRILVGACMPYAYIPRLKEMARTVGLNPALMDVVDVHTPTFNGQDSVDVAREIFSSLSMAVAKLQGVDPAPPDVLMDVSRSALVVGGGLAGLTASMAIADQGFGVCLVEAEEELGGMALRLHTQLDGTDPRKYMEDLVAQVEKHPRIKVFKDARVVLSRGSAGRFRSAISGENGIFPLEHGVTILATGGHEAKIYESGFCVHRTVMTHFGLEEKLATGALDVGSLGAVAMIQCWRSRKEGERNYCSRICCPEMLKNVLTMKERNPDLPIYVFYRDIMAQGFLETYYTRARKAGVIFIRYDLDHPPKVTFVDGKPVITALDPILGNEIRVHADILSLSSGVEPNDVDDLVEIFGVKTDSNGFFQEADSKWRPVDFLKQGVYMCGLAHSPRRMAETVASAKAAAQQSLRILSAGKVARETLVATVRPSLCSLCQACVAACPYGARTVDLENELIRVDEMLCQGCGACAAVCPNSATVIKGFHDGPMMAVIDAALEQLA